MVIHKFSRKFEFMILSIDDALDRAIWSHGPFRQLRSQMVYLYSSQWGIKIWYMEGDVYLYRIQRNLVSNRYTQYLRIWCWLEFSFFYQLQKQAPAKCQQSYKTETVRNWGQKRYNIWHLKVHVRKTHPSVTLKCSFCRAHTSTISAYYYSRINHLNIPYWDI